MANQGSKYKLPMEHTRSQEQAAMDAWWAWFQSLPEDAPACWMLGVLDARADGAAESSVSCSNHRRIEKCKLLKTMDSKVTQNYHPGLGDASQGNPEGER